LVPRIVANLARSVAIAVSILAGGLNAPAEIISGTRAIVQPIDLPEGSVYQGTANAVMSGNGGVCLTISTDNVTVSGMTFDNCRIHIYGVRNNIKITGNTFQNLTVNTDNWVARNAIFVDGSLRNSSIDHNQFRNILRGGTTRSANDPSWPNSTAITVYGLDQSTIAYNTFDRVGQAMKICMSQPYPAQNVSITRNTLTNVHRMGLELQGAQGCGGKIQGSWYNLTGLDVSYNSMTSWLDFYWESFSISVADPPNDGANKVRIHDNYLIGSRPSYTCGNCGYGIEAAGLALEVDHNTIAGPYNPLAIAIANGSAYAKVHDNYICATQPGAPIGIGLQSGTSPGATFWSNSIHKEGCPASLPNPTTGGTPPVTTTLANGTYTIAGFNGLVLDNPAYSVGQVQIIQWAKKTADINNQRWVVTNQGSGYTIANLHSGMYLMDSNGLLVQSWQNNSDSQRWLATSSSNGYILTNKVTGRMIDVPGGSTAQGTALVVASPTGATSQVWRFQ
jgi:hypothetical protein